MAPSAPPIDPRQIDIRELRYFLAAAEAGSFTHGAANAGVSQPTLSQTIKLLEDRFGCQLFERTDRRVRLTPAGEELVRHAQRAVTAVQDVCSAMDDYVRGQRGRLAVGVVQTANACMIPQVLPPFLKKHPRVELSLQELSAPAIEEALLQGTLDLGLGFLPPTNPGLQGEKLVEEEMLLVVACNHPLSQRERVTAADLAGEQLVLLSRGFCTRRLADTAFTRAGFSLTPALEMNSIEGILGVVSRTAMATILPALALETDAGRRTVGIPIEGVLLRRTLGFLWRNGGWRSPLAQSFARCCATLLNPAAPPASAKRPAVGSPR